IVSAPSCLTGCACALVLKLAQERLGYGRSVRHSSALFCGPCAACAGVSIASLNAFLNASISGAVPTVTLTCVGHAGHTLPMYTFLASMASMNCFPGRFTSTMKQLLSEGTKEYLFVASHEKTSFRMSVLIFFLSRTRPLCFKLLLAATTAVTGMEFQP